MARSRSSNSGESLLIMIFSSRMTASKECVQEYVLLETIKADRTYRLILISRARCCPMAPLAQHTTYFSSRKYIPATIVVMLCRINAQSPGTDQSIKPSLEVPPTTRDAQSRSRRPGPLSSITPNSRYQTNGDECSEESQTLMFNRNGEAS